jgi:hypothetical protein
MFVPGVKFTGQPVVHYKLHVSEYGNKLGEGMFGIRIYDV